MCFKTNQTNHVQITGEEWGEGTINTHEDFSGVSQKLINVLRKSLRILRKLYPNASNNLKTF